ncbi:unnamed protein product [Cylicocyclus nassatus]|uniref:3-beta hydroxysteroid dehydrogenase/isomerase domain-containing protein n=1 Tax=Cylicocyclus nassatus TaxID=53992 RepID=A0AA36H957_CYLNA|nr:unnamed protein product [Cylicocyclus nassatus]
MDVVAVTGSSGLAGRFVVERLAKSGRYKEIRLIDKVPAARNSIDGVQLRHFVFDISDEGALERALQGCTAVVHCAHAQMPWKYQDKKEIEMMWSDNLTATEILVDTMQRLGIATLVHVGDAYSALPIEDNYGLGELVFLDYPRNYLLGDYGESRTRGEMYARTACKKDDSFNAVFLRPVHIHGEQGSSSWFKLKEMTEQGNIPYVEGERRGMHQFIYAGNIAAIVDRCLSRLTADPKSLNGELVYCVDDTNVIPFREFLENRVRSSLFSPKVAISYEKSFLYHYLDWIKYNLGIKPPTDVLSYPMFRFLFAKTIGFSNRKQRLLLDYVPEISPEETMKRTQDMLLESPYIPRSAVKSG